MKNKILILLVLFVSVLSVALSVNVNANESEGGSSEAITAADINELNSLLDYYYNDSIYTKHTQMYVDSTKIDGDMKDYFHASVDTKERTTYYSGDSLWMSRGNGTYSYYGTSYDGEGNPNGVTNGTAYEPLVKPESIRIALRGEGKNSMDEYYVTLSDLYAKEEQNWEYSNGVYSSFDEKVIDNFRNFVAPLWLATEASKNFLDLSKATIEVNDEDLVLKLWVSVTEAEGKLVEGAIVEGEHAVFSVATINEPYIIKDIELDIPSHVDGSFTWPYENMFDGNLETFGWIAGNPSGNEMIIELSKEIMLTDFAIYQASGLSEGAGSGDQMAANVMVSTDGVDYVAIDNPNPDAQGRDIHYSTYTYFNLETPVAAKYIKLVDLDAAGWVCIREILINQGPSVQLEGFKPYRNEYSNMFDGNLDTYTWLETVGSQKDCAVVFDYGNPITFNTLNIVSDLEGGDCWYGFKVSYSVDGVSYYNLLEVSDKHGNVRNYTHQTSAPVTARYIKIEGLGNETNWLHFHEFSLSLVDKDLEVTPKIEYVDGIPTFNGLMDNNDMLVDINNDAYEWYYSNETGYHSQQVPTEAGWYSLVVKLAENEGYLLKDCEDPYHTWYVFQVVKQSTEEIIKVDAVYSTDENGATVFNSFIDEMGNPIEVDSSLYSVYYEQNEEFYSYEIPTEPGKYTLVVRFNDDANYNFITLNIETLIKKVWTKFTIETPTVKVDPEIIFNFDAYTTFVIGGELPTVTVSEGAEYVIVYSHETLLEGEVSEFPSKAGNYYAMIVKVSENDKYNAASKHILFHLEEPLTEEIVLVKVVTKTVENGVYELDHFVDSEGNIVEIDSSLYSTWYEQEENEVNPENFESGKIYSLIVKLNEDCNYKFIVEEGHKYTNTKAWPWFTYTPAA